MSGKVTSIVRSRVEYWRMTCHCLEGYGFSQFHVIIGSDQSLAYECVNCGAEHTLTPEEILGFEECRGGD